MLSPYNGTPLIRMERLYYTTNVLALNYQQNDDSILPIPVSCVNLQCMYSTLAKQEFYRKINTH